MKCMLDMDGVLCNFVDGACKLHGVKSPYEGTNEHNGVWDFVKLLPVDQEAFWEPLGQHFWSGLEWMPDGREILATVEAAFGKENVCLLTSPCMTPGCVDGKREWVAKHMPDYKQRLMIGAAKEFCASPKRVLVDDNLPNTEKFEAAGGHTVLVPRVWNHLHGADALETVKAGINRILFMHS